MWREDGSECVYVWNFGYELVRNGNRVESYNNMIKYGWFYLVVFWIKLIFWVGYRIGLSI